jgi:hypothetical protein
MCAPEPTVIVAVVLVPVVMDVNVEPPLGVCQLAEVALVAVRTCPVVGAAAFLTTTGEPVVASDVASTMPVPLGTMDAPEPTVIVAVVLVADVMALNGAAVAVMAPVPEAIIAAPVPTVMIALLLVPD